MLLRKCFGEEQRSERADDAYFCCFNTTVHSRKDRRASAHLPADRKERGLSWPSGAGGSGGIGSATPPAAAGPAAASAAGVGLSQIGTAGPMAEARPTTTKQGAACNYPPLIPISTDGEVADYASSRRAVGRLCHGDPDSDNSCIRPPPNKTVFGDFSPPPPPSSRGRNARVQLRGDTCQQPGSRQALGLHLSSVARGDCDSGSARPAATRKSSSASGAGGSTGPPPQYSDLFRDGSAAAATPGSGPGNGCRKPTPT